MHPLKKSLYFRRAKIALGLATVALLCACGFQLRGQTTLPFETLYVQGSTPMLVELKRNIAASSRARAVADLEPGTTTRARSGPAATGAAQGTGAGSLN